MNRIFKNKSLVFLIYILLISGCSITASPDYLTQARQNIIQLQNNEDVKIYAAHEMKQAEDTTIAAVNAWNNGQHAEASQLAKKAEEQIALAYKVAKGEASLGLTKEAWQQRRFLQEQRRARMKSPSL